jgi:hypothetical protein
MNLKRLIKEPLVHFIFISFCIFELYDFVSSSKEQTPKVSISQARVEQLVSRFEKLWFRAPSIAEVEVLKNNYLLDQIYALKARELGLDINDAVITKRLRQKAEFMLYGADKVPKPSEQELLTFYQNNAPLFTSINEYKLELITQEKDSPAAQLSIFLSLSPSQIEQDPRIKNMDFLAEPELVKLFDESLINAIKTNKKNQWLGPFESNSSLFYAKVVAIKVGKLADFEQVKSQVLILYKEHKSKDFQKQHEQELLSKYQRNAV